MAAYRSRVDAILAQMKDFTPHEIDCVMARLVSRIAVMEMEARRSRSIRDVLCALMDEAMRENPEVDVTPLRRAGDDQCRVVALLPE